MNLFLTLLDFYAISPLLILIFGALLLILLESFSEKRSKKYSVYVTFFIFSLALLAAINAPKSENPLLVPWLKFDFISRFFTYFFLAIGLGATLLADGFFKRFGFQPGEYYFLLISSVFGLMLIGAAADFLTLFLGIETLSISLYVLCAYVKKWTFGAEAALKYFFLGSIAAAFLLYGIAFLYGALGNTNLDAYTAFEKSSYLFLGGTAFLTVGLAFEAALVPFHLWAPDVYDGAPTPVTALMAVGTKVGAFAAFIRIFFNGSHLDPYFQEVLVLLAFFTLLYSNFVALRQNQLRRFFAYSGIAHAGFLLIPLAAGGPLAVSSMFFYLMVYSLATFGAFSVLAILDKNEEGVMVSDLKGLFFRNPWLSLFFTLCLLTLGGIPPTAGFFAKFFLFKVAFEAGYTSLVILGLLMTILSSYYYLRILSVMFIDVSHEKNETLLYAPIFLSFLVFLGLLLLSVFPGPFFVS